MTAGKKILKFISSMRFAIILLVILAIACSLGSLVPQGKTYAWYAANYSERTAALILALHLDDAFHSWWFILITGFLCMNLLLCNLIRLPSLIRRTRSFSSFDTGKAEGPTLSSEFRGDVSSVFQSLKMPGPRETSVDGHRALFSSKNALGLWGAWICHLGVLLLILGYGLGQITYKDYVAYGVAGDTMAIGDTSLVLTIDDFRIDLREDDTVEQYTADITVRDLAVSPMGRSATISVNHPADLFGLRFYQNSTGWAARVSVMKEGQEIQDKVVCAGDYLAIADKPELVIYFNAFYPDYVFVQGSGPATLTGRLNNPAYLYSVYYQNQMLGMNVLMPSDVLTIDEYTVRFSEPQNYTLIHIKKDSFSWLAFVGGVIVMVGLLLAFYILPRKVWAVESESGIWTVEGSCRKGSVLFAKEFHEAVKRQNAIGEGADAQS